MLLWNRMYKFPMWTRFDCSLSKAPEPPLPQKRGAFCRPHTPPTPWLSSGWLIKPWHSDFCTEFWGTSQVVWEGQTRSEVGDSLSFLGAINTPPPAPQSWQAQSQRPPVPPTIWKPYIAHLRCWHFIDSWEWPHFYSPQQPLSDIP